MSHGLRDETTFFEVLSTFIGAMLLMAAIIVGSVLINAVALQALWNWFVPHTFIGAPHLSIGEAIGLALIPAFFVIKHSKTKETPKAVTKQDETPARKPKVNPMRGVVSHYGGVGLVVLMGYIVHLIIA